MMADDASARSTSFVENGVSCSTSTGTPASAGCTAAPRPPGFLTPKKSPSEAAPFKLMKKTSPLKHVTPILKKYSAQRKAKSTKKPFTVALVSKKKIRQRKHSASSCSEVEFSFEPSPDKNESLSPEKEFLSSEDQDDQQLRTPSPPCACPEEEPTEEIDYDAPSSPLEKDNAEDLAALMHASSNVIPGLKSKSNLARRRRHMKEVEATLQILLQEDPAIVDERENNIAVSYMRRVHEVLLAEGDEGERTLKRFLQALMDAEHVLNTEIGIQHLYKTVSELFKGKSELLDPFISFLKPGEARAVGKAMENMELSNMTDFLLKAEAAFSKQPQMLKSILGHLTTFASKPDVNEEEIKCVILPLLKGHPLLKDCFLQLLPDSKPPESQMIDFEELFLDDGTEDDDQSVENLIIPCDDTKDLAGGDSCPCPCHENVEDELLKSRANHCISCGIKYLNGKIYMVTNRQLKPATLSFLNENMKSAIKRLSADTLDKGRPRRCRAGLSSSNVNPQVSSPQKGRDSENEDSENWRVEFESSPVKAHVQQQSEEEAASENKSEIKAHVDLISPGSSENSREPSGLDELIACDEESMEFIEDEESVDDEEIPEDYQDVELPDYDDDSSLDNDEINTIMKEEDIQVEVSQTEGKHSIGRFERLVKDELLEVKKQEEWTRDEDKIILQVIEKNSNANLIDVTKELLPNRSQQQIKERFDTLMKLLAKMSSEANGD